jgi:outer membrane protein
MLLLGVLTSPGAAQDARPDTLARAAGRPIEKLVADLPGVPMSLRDVVAIALERNLDLEAARTRRRLADARVQIQRGLFDPTLSLGGSLARDRAQSVRWGTYAASVDQALPWGTILGLGVQGGRDPFVPANAPAAYGADATLTVRQPLLEGLGTLDAGVREARALRDAAVASLARESELVTADVEAAYWTLAEAEVTEAVLQRSVEIAQALLFRNEELARRQLVPEMDVVTARSALALRRAGLVSAQLARANAADRIVFLAWGAEAVTRLASSSLPLKTTGSAEDPPLALSDSLEAVVAAGLARRLDAQAARAAVAAVEESARGARGRSLPSVDLSGALSSTAAGSTLGGSFGSLDRRPAWSFGLTVSQSLLNLRDRGADLQTDLTLLLRRLDLSLVENDVRLEIRAARRAVAAGAERLAAANEAASLAGEQLEGERRRLDLGLGDSFRLLQTEEIAVQSQLEAVRARFDLARAATSYRLAAGGTGGG